VKQLLSKLLPHLDDLNERADTTLARESEREAQKHFGLAALDHEVRNQHQERQPRVRLAVQSPHKSRVVPASLRNRPTEKSLESPERRIRLDLNRF
jgi:hypothetical protein